MKISKNIGMNGTMNSSVNMTWGRIFKAGENATEMRTERVGRTRRKRIITGTIDVGAMKETGKQ